MNRPYVRRLFADPMLVGFEIDGNVYSPQDVNILFAEPNNTGANPETCLHRVIGIVIADDPRYIPIICFSCDSTIDAAWVSARDWEFDPDHNVWVQQGPTRR